MTPCVYVCVELSDITRFVAFKCDVTDWELLESGGPLSLIFSQILFMDWHMGVPWPVLAERMDRWIINEQMHPLK